MLVGVGCFGGEGDEIILNLDGGEGGRALYIY